MNDGVAVVLRAAPARRGESGDNGDAGRGDVVVIGAGAAPGERRRWCEGEREGKGRGAVCRVELHGGDIPFGAGGGGGVDNKLVVVDIVGRTAKAQTQRRGGNAPGVVPLPAADGNGDHAVVALLHHAHQRRQRGRQRYRRSGAVVLGLSANADELRGMRRRVIRAKIPDRFIPAAVIIVRVRLRIAVRDRARSRRVGGISAGVVATRHTNASTKAAARPHVRAGAAVANEPSAL